MTSEGAASGRGWRRLPSCGRMLTTSDFATEVRLMKALILNSGLGSRMGVLTSEHPKCMTEVNNRDTILSRQLKMIAAAGISEVVMTTGYYDEVLIDYCHSLDLPLRFMFVKNPIYDKKNYIYSIYCAREYLDDDIILMHGDLVFENEVFDRVVSSPVSCMTVSSTLPLPEKDFKAVVIDGMVRKVGIDFVNDAMAAQALYHLKKENWKIWLKKISEFCESGNTKVYAENALNELDGAAQISALDVEDLLCAEIDNPEDLANVCGKLRQIESRTVYMCLSADIIHGGHIAIIKKAQKLGKLIVGVLSDEAIMTYKDLPLVPAEERKVIVENIKGVYKVVDQKTLSYKDNLLSFRPDFVVHGDDWNTGVQKPVRDEVLSILSTYGGRLIEYPYSSDRKYQDIDRKMRSDLPSPEELLAKKGQLEEKTGPSEVTVIDTTDRYSGLDSWFSDKKKILLVCGESINNYTTLNHKLLKSRVPIVRFTDFHPNPDYESVVRGVEVFRSENCDCIMAVGGGSAIDVAKCIKLFSNMPGSGENGGFLRQEIVPNTIPFLAMPTTAGTGTEATRYAVIYYEGQKQSVTSYSIIPTAIVMDPGVLTTLPMYHRKATMCDALCHAIESYWSVNSTDESKACAKTAIEGVLAHMDGYLENTDEGNAGMLRAAHEAGKAINISQTTAGHAMCYMITSLFGFAHGHAAMLCNRVLMPWMIKNTDKCCDPRGEAYLRDTLDELGVLLGGRDSEDGAARIKEIFRKLDLERPNISEEQFEILIGSVNPVRLKNHPITLDAETIERLYREMI